MPSEVVGLPDHALTFLFAFEVCILIFLPLAFEVHVLPHVLLLLGFHLLMPEEWSKKAYFHIIRVA